MSAISTIQLPIPPRKFLRRWEVPSNSEMAVAIANPPPPSTIPPGIFHSVHSVPSVSSVPSVLKSPAPANQIDSRPTIELIVERQMLVAVLLPRELTQAQLLIAEFLVKGHWRLRIDLAEVWRQWRVYAPPFWMACPEATQPQKPTGSKLFFA